MIQEEWRYMFSICFVESSIIFRTAPCSTTIIQLYLLYARTALHCGMQVETGLNVLDSYESCAVFASRHLVPGDAPRFT